MIKLEEKLKFMRAAFKEAMRAREKEEIPVGAVIVKEGRIIAKGRNRNREKNDATRHAEIIAIEKASKKLKSERLLGCVLYVTKEPCSMCAGAIINARLEKVVIGAEDTKYGACGTVLSICGNKKLNHVPEIEFGVLREESSSILKDFFAKLRSRRG